LFQVGPSHLPADITALITKLIDERLKTPKQKQMPELNDILQFSPPLMEERELEEEEEESEYSDSDCIVIGHITSRPI